MAEIQFRLERDTSSGRIHKRYADEFGRFELTRERCQRDQSGTYSIIVRDPNSQRADGLPDGTLAAALCKFDFPESI